MGGTQSPTSQVAGQTGGRIQTVMNYAANNPWKAAMMAPVAPAIGLGMATYAAGTATAKIGTTVATQTSKHYGSAANWVRSKAQGIPILGKHIALNPLVSTPNNVRFFDDTEIKKTFSADKKDGALQNLKALIDTRKEALDIVKHNRNNPTNPKTLTQAHQDALKLSAGDADALRQVSDAFEKVDHHYSALRTLQEKKSPAATDTEIENARKSLDNALKELDKAALTNPRALQQFQHPQASQNFNLQEMFQKAFQIDQQNKIVLQKSATLGQYSNTLKTAKGIVSVAYPNPSFAPPQTATTGARRAAGSSIANKISWEFSRSPTQAEIAEGKSSGWFSIKEKMTPPQITDENGVKRDLNHFDNDPNIGPLLALEDARAAAALLKAKHGDKIKFTEYPDGSWEIDFGKEGNGVSAQEVADAFGKVAQENYDARIALKQAQNTAGVTHQNQQQPQGQVTMTRGAGMTAGHNLTAAATSSVTSPAADGTAAAAAAAGPGASNPYVAGGANPLTAMPGNPAAAQQRPAASSQQPAASSQQPVA